MLIAKDHHDPDTSIPHEMTQTEMERDSHKLDEIAQLKQEDVSRSHSIVITIDRDRQLSYLEKKTNLKCFPTNENCL